MTRSRLALLFLFLIVVIAGVAALNGLLQSQPLGAQLLATPVLKPTNTPPSLPTLPQMAPPTLAATATREPPSRTPEPTFTPGILRVIVASPTAPVTATAVLPAPAASATPTRPPLTATRITTPGAASAAAIATVTPGSGIIWTQSRGDSRDLWVMGADGSNLRRLTGVDAANREPSFSPDGRSLVFTSNRDGDNEIYSAFADGSNQTRLTNYSANDYAASWSPDGRMIVFVSNRDGNDEIYVMKADGSDQRRLTDSPGFDGQPVWSPDGKQIAFTSNRNGNLNVYVLPATGGTATRLTQEASDDRDPAWAPDGSLLAFVSNRAAGLQIYTMRADGTDAKKLTGFAKGAEHPSWGPAMAAGMPLVFVAYSGDADSSAAAEIYTIRGDGSEQRRLTQNLVADTEPMWYTPLAPVAMLPMPAAVVPVTPPTRVPASVTVAASPTKPTESVTPAAPVVAGAEIVIDDQSPQFTRGGNKSYWRQANIGYEKHMWYTYNAAKEDNTGRWTPQLGQAGKWEVFVYIPAQNATTQKAQYTIAHAGKQDKQVINQNLYANAWLSLGTYDFNAKGDEYVKLSDVTGETRNTKRVGFDAMRFVFKGP